MWGRLFICGRSPFMETLRGKIAAERGIIVAETHYLTEKGFSLPQAAEVLTQAVRRIRL